MHKFIEEHIYSKVARAFTSVNKAAKLFQGFLDMEDTSIFPDYYRARNKLREGEEAYKDALRNAKKMLGPLPEYVKDDYLQWREEFLEQHQILAKGNELEELRKELETSDFLNQWMTEEDIDKSLDQHYHSQQEGKRKMVNIKVRIILDKLKEVLINTKELQKQTMKKQQENL